MSRWIASFSRPQLTVPLVVGLMVLWTAALPAAEPTAAAAPITLASLLGDLIDVDSIARWPSPAYSCRQASSYDRAKIAPDKPGWFANNDNTNFLRTDSIDGRTEQVMLDEPGPGTLVRFWLTAGGEKNGVLRIYLDGATEPSLTFRAFDLMQGDLDLPPPLLQPHPGYSPTGGGNNLWLPIPYAKHCKVTWEERSAGQRYYQINYRTYPPATSVETFTRAALDAARDRLGAVRRQLESPPGFTPGTIRSLNESIPPGGRWTLELPPGPAAVRGLELRLTPAHEADPERALRSVIVRMAFDGGETVWCPAPDFFGTAIGINELRSFFRTVGRDGTMSCRWPMPYEKSARIALENLGDQAVGITLHATVSPWRWDDRSMHFHTAWHQQSGLTTPPPSDWNFLRLTGRGVYVGDSLALFNPVATWYGEGDEKIFVDGEAFPSHLGTGTEDYYGYSYAPKGIIQTPFGGQVRIDEPMTQGWNVMSRTRHLDAIPFHTSLDFDLELIAWKPTELTSAATTHWYAFPGVTTNRAPLPDQAVLPIPTLAGAKAAALAKIRRKPGARECESLDVVASSGDFRVFAQEMSPWDATRWSGGEHLTVMARQEGDFVELAVPADDDKPRRLLLDLTKAPDFGTLAFAVNGVASAATFDAWAVEVEPGGTIELGTFSPRDGRFLVRAEVTGANPRSAGARFFFGLDCLVIEPAP